MKELDKYYPDFLDSEVISLLKRVKKITWGEFLNSGIFSKWLTPIVAGYSYGNQTDRDIAAFICEKLPGIDHDSEGFDRYQWTCLEASHPGRYLYMRSLKLRVMKVSTSSWKRPETVMV